MASLPGAHGTPGDRLVGRHHDRVRGHPGNTLDRSASVERRTLLAIGGLLLGVWLAVVFAGSLGTADHARAQAAEARQATQLLRDRVSAGLDEIATVRGAAFLAFQASAYGYGRNGERWFALQGSNVALPSIVPLGHQPAAVPAGGSGSWFDLLFGS